MKGGLFFARLTKLNNFAARRFATDAELRHGLARIARRFSLDYATIQHPLRKSPHLFMFYAIIMRKMIFMQKYREKHLAE